MGDDADSFEIVDMGLYLKAGTTLHRKAKAAYAVTVAMRDVTVAGSPMTVDFILAVTNGDEGFRAT